MKVYTLSCFLLGTLALALAARPDTGSLDAATIAVQELDRVLSLPGQPSYSPAFKQYSGYVTTDEYLGKALFYWFFEATDRPDEKPLRFPQHKAKEFYIAGESYAEENKKASEENYINFKGILIGNAYMDGDTDLWGIVDSAWHHAIISDNLYSDFQKNCNFSLVDLSPECSADIAQYTALYNIIDIYSLYTDRCEHGYPDFNTSFSAQIGRTGNGRTYATEYFNRKDVQKALHADHAGASHPFSLCRIPTTSTRYTLKKLGLPIKEDWSPWFHHEQVGGWTVVYDGLTFVTVRGAGHMVPSTQPEQALELFKHFLANTNLPSKPF
nr:unnamed protein product [Digitaria exilis]